MSLYIAQLSCCAMSFQIVKPDMNQGGLITCVSTFTFFLQKLNREIFEEIEMGIVDKVKTRRAKHLDIGHV